MAKVTCKLHKLTSSTIQNNISLFLTIQSARPFKRGAKTHLVVLALGHKVHSAVDGLLLVLGNGHQVVKVPLKQRMQVLRHRYVQI